MDHQTIVIKKYENRRLYDTTESRYVNLDEVAQMVREGKDVKVKDAVTGEDLTRLVLTQIIVERAKAADSDFPVDVLRQMVVASGRATQETMLKYMKAAVDMYQDAYRAISPTLSLSVFVLSACAARLTHRLPGLDQVCIAAPRQHMPAPACHALQAPVKPRSGRPREELVFEKRERAEPRCEACALLETTQSQQSIHLPERMRARVSRVPGMGLLAHPILERRP